MYTYCGKSWKILVKLGAEVTILRRYVKPGVKPPGPAWAVSFDEKECSGYVLETDLECIKGNNDLESDTVETTEPKREAEPEQTDEPKPAEKENNEGADGKTKINKHMKNGKHKCLSYSTFQCRTLIYAKKNCEVRDNKCKPKEEVQEIKPPAEQQNVEPAMTREQSRANCPKSIIINACFVVRQTATT